MIDVFNRWRVVTIEHAKILTEWNKYEEHSIASLGLVLYLEYIKNNQISYF